MNRLRLILCIILGLVYFVFGLNGFLHFLPMPPLSGPSGDFAGAMIKTGYLFGLVKGTEVLGGAMLLTGLFVPLALLILAPITINIVFFHAFLAPEGLALPLGMVVVHLLLGFLYREQFASVLKARV